MLKVGFGEMSAFAAIAERSSFARAAAHLGVSRSTLSETLRTLEGKLGVRLLNRTTRSVALTDAGERLLAQLRPVLDNFEAVVESVNLFRDKPAGNLRLTLPRPTAHTIIEPILAKFLTSYPDIVLDVSVDSSLRDIVRERFDAGIRPGHRVEKDMIAIRIGGAMPTIIVASPDYLARNSRPTMPRDLEKHNCIRQRFASGATHAWTFEKRGKSLEVEISGSFITNDGDLMIRAALDGLGIARLPENFVSAFIARKRLIPLLEDWAPRPVEWFLYYSSRRQVPATLQAFIDFVRVHARDGG